MKIFKNIKGFTLIELIITIAILGILAGIAVPKVSESVKMSRVNTIAANAYMVSKVVNQLYYETGALPPTTDVFTNQTTDATMEQIKSKINVSLYDDMGLYKIKSFNIGSNPYYYIFFYLDKNKLSSTDVNLFSNAQNYLGTSGTNGVYFKFVP